MFDDRLVSRVDVLDRAAVRIVVAWRLTSHGAVSSDDSAANVGDPVASVDDSAERWATWAATPAGAGLADALAAADTRCLDEHGLVEAAAGWQRLISWAQACQADVLAELAARAAVRPADTGYRSVNPIANTAMVIAGRLTTTTRQAENLVGRAVQLRRDFTATWAALRAGALDERRARVITDELGRLDAPARTKVEARALSQAPSHDSVGLRRVVKRLACAADPAESAQRHTHARQRRFVAVTPAEDGMAWLEAFLPAEDASAVKTILDAAAETAKRRDREAGCPTRTADQRRADALAHLAWTALTTGHPGTGATSQGSTSAESGGAGSDHAAGSAGARDLPPAGAGDSVGTGANDGIVLSPARGRPVAVGVTLALTTLAGLDDQPAELDGYGPIPAAVGRRLAAAGVWRWLGTHPATGQLLDFGLTRYRPTRALADFITHRDRSCRAPGCHRRAADCDIDHAVPHADGGPTNPVNCTCLCRTHHLLKHHGGWTLQPDGNGGHAWTSPTGHRYLKPPEPIGPVVPDGATAAPPVQRSPGGSPSQRQRPPLPDPSGKPTPPSARPPDQRRRTHRPPRSYPDDDDTPPF